ncbi:hypothetical protein PMAYCL1PPCAC_18576, partial [Pristionchus mayeri]
WIVVCSITWVFLFIWCCTSIWWESRERERGREGPLQTGNSPHAVHSTEQYPVSDLPPMEITCISAPKSRSRSRKSNKKLRMSRKAKSHPKSDQLGRSPVKTPGREKNEIGEKNEGQVKVSRGRR